MLNHRSALRSLGLVILFVLSMILPARSQAEPPVDPVEVPITFTKVGQSPDWVKFEPHHQLAERRYGHTATLLPTGNVLVVGGVSVATYFQETAVLASAELFNPTTGNILSAGSMAITRTAAAATLLPNGEVLITGGGSVQTERYTPATNSWQLGATMLGPRYSHTATLLANGKVLIAGGAAGGDYTFASIASVELYDPATNRFSAHNSMTQARNDHQAVLLPNGNVLMVGGAANNALADLYDVATGTWQSITLNEPSKAALLLPDGKVLIVGEHLHLYDPTSGGLIDLNQPGLGFVNRLVPFASNKVLIVGSYSYSDMGGSNTTYRIYEPATNTLGAWFTPTFRFSDQWTTPPSNSVYVPLPDGRFVITGGFGGSFRFKSSSRTIMVAGLRSRTTFGISLTFPGVQVGNQPWVIRRELPVQVQVHVVPPPTGPLQIKFQDNYAPTTFNSGEPFSVNLHLAEGYDPSYLINPVVSEPDQAYTRLDLGRIAVITAMPTIGISYLGPTSISPVQLYWGGAPEGGISGYDFRVRHEDDLHWSALVSDSPSTNTLWHAPRTGAYLFQARSRDRVGRSSEWSNLQTTTVTHITAPALPVVINNGALATTDPLVTLGFAGQMLLPGVAEMRLNIDGLHWEPWQPYKATLQHVITQPGPNMILVQFRDQAGTVSPFVAPTIRLDQAAGSEVLASINNGAVFTNDRTVRIMTGGPAGATQIQISNDGGFAGATWQPFDTQTPWQITTYGNFAIPRSVYVRVRTADGTIIGPTSDDIMYDPIPPTGSITVIDQTPISLRVALTASDPDNISGLAGMRVGTPEQFAAAPWEPFAAERILLIPNSPSSQPVYAQFRDAANNTTPILCVTPAGSACGPTPRLNLPFIAQ